MKPIFTAVCIFLYTSAPSFAATPSTESLDALFEVTRAQALVSSMSANVEQSIRLTTEQALGGKTLNDAERRAIDNMTKKAAEIVRQELTWDKLRPIYINIYQESLTQEDIDGLVAFYRSPAGDAMVKKMPLVGQKTMGAVQAMIGPMMKKLQSAQAEAMAEIKGAQ